MSALACLPDLGGTGSLVGFTLIATALAACGLVEVAGRYCTSRTQRARQGCVAGGVTSGTERQPGWLLWVNLCRDVVLPKAIPFTITALCQGVARTETRKDRGAAVVLAYRWAEEDGCCEVRITDPDGTVREREACRVILRHKHGLGPGAKLH